MPLLGLVGSSPAPPEAPAVALTLQLLVEDALATANRLWVRGRVHGLPNLTDPSNRHWWDRRKARAEAGPPRVVRLECRAGGLVLETDVSLRHGGQFEASFPAALGTPHRG